MSYRWNECQDPLGSLFQIGALPVSVGINTNAEFCISFLSDTAIAAFDSSISIDEQ